MSTFTLTSQTYRRQAEASLPISMTQVLALAGMAMHALWVKRRLDEIFRFRYHALARHFR